MKQRTFLPLFFLGLAVVLVAAVGLRIRAYNTGGEAHATINSESPVAPTVAVQERRTDGMTAAQPDVIPVSQTVAAAQQRTVAGGGATATTAPVGMSREQRFAEALAAAQRAGSDSPQKLAMPKPAPAPSAPAVLNAPKPPENPGLLARIGNAISNAFSGSSRASAAPQPAPQNQQNNPSQRHGDAPREKDVPDRPREKDPTSDTTPPQLQGIIFQPPSINDGQETALIVTAVDDLSGIRNISGSVASPTGKALQGFACQREAPESNRYIARIVVPKDAEQGFWKINFLSLTDNASNTTNINMAQTGGAGFTVNSARPDSQPPSLRGVYVDKRSMTGGEKNTIFVQATDDKSGVAIVSGVFQSPNKSARIGFGCRPTGNDNFECDFVPPKDIDCGDWQLEQIQLQDKAQNMATIRGDNPLVAAVKINMLANRCDSTPPAVENLQLDPLDTTANGVVTVTGTVTDDISGVASISGQAAGPPSPDNAQQPPRVYFSFQAGPDPNTWIGKINMPDKAAKGTWSIVWLQTIDKANNNRTYTVNDAVLQGTKFTVR